METTKNENKKSFLQNGGLIVCSLLTLYGLCICSFGSVVFWRLRESRQMVSVDSTATAISIATQQSAATSTAVARVTEQSQYKFIDRFDSNTSNWMTGPQNDEYWQSSVSVKDGVYAWDVEKVNKTFVYWADFYHGFPMKDFDAYLDTKFIAGTPGAVCGGLVFRKSSKGWDDGAYVFSICNDSLYKIEYHGRDGWEYLLRWTYDDTISVSDWNRIEVKAKGDHFNFAINNKDVYELVDARQLEGGLAIIIDVRDKNPAVIWFDNFAYQTR